MKAKRPGLMEYEYWHYWVFFAPFLLYWFYQSVRAGSFSYFCRVNPGIRFGGFLDYSKSELLDFVPDKAKPHTIFLHSKSDLTSLPEFPFVVKPDMGERGRNVEIIRSEADWQQYPLDRNLIIQEYIDYPLEYGLFFIRYEEEPNGKILSVTGKEFLIYDSSDGKTLEEFVLNNPRAYQQHKRLKKRFADIWNQKPTENKKILLEPIGNHNRGTRFYEASHLISDKLTQTVSELTREIKGFHYGRLDVRAQSEEDLKNGQFKILEINGANSEPTHIYDSKFNLWNAYKELKRHLDIQYKIAVQNPKTYSSKDFYFAVLKRFL